MVRSYSTLALASCDSVMPLMLKSLCSEFKLFCNSVCYARTKLWEFALLLFSAYLKYCISNRYCISCSPYFNASDNRNNIFFLPMTYENAQSWLSLFCIFLPSFEISHCHMLRWLLSFLCYFYSAFIELRHFTFLEWYGQLHIYGLFCHS